MKKIAVLGDSRGIGLALRNQLLASGQQVIGASRSTGESGDRYTHFQHDVVANPLNLSDYTDHLDGLVYCPGTINLKPFRGFKKTDVLNDIEVNYLGAFLNIQANLKLLKASDQGRVVLFSTVAVQTGMSFHASIAGAKAAIEGLTRSLAAELAPAIRVNCIAPSLTNTSLAEGFLNNDKKLESANQRHPLKRIGTAEELASTAAWLLSDESSWITGQIIHQDGGLGSVR